MFLKLVGGLSNSRQLAVSIEARLQKRVEWKINLQCVFYPHWFVVSCSCDRVILWFKFKVYAVNFVNKHWENPVYQCILFLDLTPMEIFKQVGKNIKFLFTYDLRITDV